ncbi:hypothetical protein G6F46_011749 [Rhizopus delemar]|uniref:LysM domain-containing protein n=2 Tax=Rhizopus TaxID=4842 RepID=A0A9P7CIS8_9FUNG|nr:hypothetical protein G6F55_011307 [Rhizopus delemar]KAG1534952.1 hypothetical protein G6F51_011803 [Rhizopus arrhizus]KAG1489330.1 hypothetical protein G6F54_011517 [Rhizopus delemar]KAG1498983.1 hypothetical protein G6F53_011620 [Rhizopus delemar]KAG1513876.1 hypothetical protein G6F52_010058 [Rhizopus delemar]
MVRVLSIVCAAVALFSTAAVAKKSDVVQQYTVSCSKTYIVKNGDTCSKIDKAFGLTFSKLRKWNPSINSRCTNLYIDQVLCLSAPVTKSSAVNVGHKTTKTKTTKKSTKKKSTKKSTKKKSTKTKTTTVLTMTNTPPECRTDDDCAGIRCCNLFTNKCVLDPEGTICDIKPTTTVIKTTVKGTKTITTKVTTKNTAPAVPTATTTPGLSGLTVQISSSADFCLFLPSSPGNKDGNGGKVDKDAIADSEKNAVSFCTKPNINAPGAGIFPAGFIKKARYQTNTAAGFVQVRGTLDISAYDLSNKDDGGQYDNHGKGSPPKSTCAGYPYYVSLIEPSSADFCIRCCESYSDCNAGRSAYGCDRVVPEL